jgi:hypothetical protein
MGRWYYRWYYINKIWECGLNLTHQSPNFPTACLYDFVRTLVTSAAAFLTILISAVYTVNVEAAVLPIGARSKYRGSGRLALEGCAVQCLCVLYRVSWSVCVAMLDLARQRCFWLSWGSCASHQVRLRETALVPMSARSPGYWMQLWEITSFLEKVLIQGGESSGLHDLYFICQV